MKREGTFCDLVGCPDVAVGQCVCCDKDVCVKHGSMRGIEIRINRIAPETTSHLPLVDGGVTICYECVNKLARKPELFKESVLPDLLSSVGEAIKAALVADALNDSEKKVDRWGRPI